MREQLRASLQAHVEPVGQARRALGQLVGSLSLGGWDWHNSGPFLPLSPRALLHFLKTFLQGFFFF